MALTNAERERVRYHLGYLNVAPAASISFGVPRPQQTIFLVDSAMSNLLTEGEDRVRRILTTLDGIECRLVEAQDRLAVSRVDDIDLRPDETQSLEREYARWAKRLADQLGVPLYPYSSRFANYGPGNVPVSG